LKLNERRFQQHEKLMLKYIDNKDDLELHCLYAVQALINKLEHPQGKLHYRAVMSCAVGYGLCPERGHSLSTVLSSLFSFLFFPPPSI
jgi:hypothetical protein